MGCCFSGPPKLPVFNLTCNVWFGYVGAYPIVIPPNLAAVPCQLLFGPTLVNTSVANLMLIKFPALTDVAAQRGGGFAFGDVIECPVGSLRYYLVMFVDDVGKGFPNEHRACVLSQQPPWPVPTP